MPESRTQELRIEQMRREATERTQAATETEEQAAVTHDRRAERAAYLREKLTERARSEDEAGTSDA